jgi:hypothetical protein
MRPISKHLLIATIALLPLTVLTQCADELTNPSPEIYFNVNGEAYEDGATFEIDMDSTLVLNPRILYDYGSDYKWINEGAVVSESKDYSYKPTNKETLHFKFIVATPSGSDTANIYVQSMDILSFDDKNVIKINNKDSLLYSGASGANNFTYKGITFSIESVGERLWNGFAISNGTVKSVLTTDTQKKYIYSAYPGSGSLKSSQYLVFHQSDNIAQGTIQFESGNHTIKSMDIVNTSYVYNAIKNGINGNPAFGTGKTDVFTLTIKGYDSNGNLTSTGMLPLADYTNPIVTERSMIDAWTTIPLNALGKVNKVVFTLTSTDLLNGTMNTPAYFCIDNIKVTD